MEGRDKMGAAVASPEALASLIWDRALLAMVHSLSSKYLTSGGTPKNRTPQMRRDDYRDLSLLIEILTGITGLSDTAVREKLYSLGLQRRVLTLHGDGHYSPVHDPRVWAIADVRAKVREWA